MSVFHIVAQTVCLLLSREDIVFATENGGEGSSVSDRMPLLTFYLELQMRPRALTTRN